MNKSEFSNMLLVAMPGIEDPNFKHAVIYVCEHQDQGSVGLIINHPLQFQISMIFDQLNIPATQHTGSSRPLLFGGPIQPERGFVIHKQIGSWQSSLILRDDVTITTSNDIIRSIAVDEGPQDLLVTLGFTAWKEKELEDEIKQDFWLLCPFNAEILYEVPFEQRWFYAGSLLGVNMNQMTTQSGHA